MIDPTRDAVEAIRSWSSNGSSSAQAVAAFAVTLPVFTGHFPNRPVIPGVHQLALVAELVRRALDQPGIQIVEIIRSKWTRPLAPGDQLTVLADWAIQPDHIEIDGRILHHDVPACICRLIMR